MQIKLTLDQCDDITAENLLELIEENGDNALAQAARIVFEYYAKPCQILRLVEIDRSSGSVDTQE